MKYCLCCKKVFRKIFGAALRRGGKEREMKSTVANQLKKLSGAAFWLIAIIGIFAGAIDSMSSGSILLANAAPAIPFFMFLKTFAVYLVVAYVARTVLFGFSEVVERLYSIDVHFGGKVD